MERKTSNKTLIIIIAILLIANIATVGLMLFGKGEPKQPVDDRKVAMRNFLRDSVKFTEAQLTEFDTIKSRHRDQVKAIFDSIRADKTNILKKLGSEGFPDSSLSGAAEAAAGQQKLVELQMLHHLKDIRRLCTPDQLQRFDTGFFKIMNKPPPDDKKKEK